MAAEGPAAAVPGKRPGSERKPRLGAVGEAWGRLPKKVRTAVPVVLVIALAALYPGLMQSVTQVLHSTEEKTNSLLGRK